MPKKRETRPKHSLHANRSNGGNNNNHRSAATVRRLKMYNTRPKRNVKGKIIKVEYGSKDLPSTRIQPDLRWFIPTRVIDQKALERFREELESRMSNNYNVILREKKLPMSLLNNLPKLKRDHLLDAQPLKDIIGPKGESAIVQATDCQALLQKADTAQDAFKQRVSAKTSTEADEEDGSRDLAWDTMFEKGESKHIRSEFYKVIDSSDVVIQVLDARDPQGTRSYPLEKHLKENCKHKHTILLLNKCDLLPAWATKGWIRELSKEYPTLAFHANISKPFGKDSLLSVLRQFAELKSDNQAISVGFVGYPKVGKSSVIHTLRTENVRKVASTPGEGKVLQYITLTEKVFLIDCPGVVYPNRDSQTDIVLKGMVRVENLQDAAKHIGQVFKLVKKDHLERTYKIKDWENENDFLVKFCNLTGKLLKDGEPDLITAAKMVLNDMQRGKIPFFVSPSEAR